VSDNIQFCDEVEKSIKTIKFSEDLNLKHEYVKSLKNHLIKKVQLSNYNKQTNELKATNLTSSNNNKTNDSSSNWRKGSNDLTTPSSKNEASAKRINAFNDTTSNSNSYTNTNLHKRERFNSDGDKNSNTGYNNNKPSHYTAYYSAFQNPIKLDYSKLTIKYNKDSNIFL